jgi:hypothetical protein
MVGDRITSKVRVQAWLLAKSLNAIQIITDEGCLFQYRFQIKKHLKVLKTFNQRPFKRLLAGKHRSIEKFLRWHNGLITVKILQNPITILITLIIY